MKLLNFAKGELTMKQINRSDIKDALHTHIDSKHASVVFENIWEKYSNRKSGGHPNRRIYRKRIIVLSILGSLCFLTLSQSPVRAFIEQFIEVQWIKNVKNAEIGYSWANTAGDARSLVLNKEEAEKSLGISIPWPDPLDGMSGQREIRTRKKDDSPLGYDYTIRTNDRYYEVIANYKNNRQPEFYAQTTGTALVKEISIQDVTATLITSPEFIHVPHLYFEKGDWKIVVTVTDYTEDDVMSEQEIIELAGSIK